MDENYADDLVNFNVYTECTKITCRDHMRDGS